MHEAWASARKVFVGSDHVGLELKEYLLVQLKTAGHEVDDLGVRTAARVNYNDMAVACSRSLLVHPSAMGVLVCGTGVGMQIAANRYTHVRAAALNDRYTAAMSRAHNDANLACFGSRVIAGHVAWELLEIFLSAPFDGGRHVERVELLSSPDRLE